MPMQYKFIKETTATEISESDVLNGDLYYTRYSSGGTTENDITDKYYCIVPKSDITVNFYGATGSSIYVNRKNYSACKVAFYRYGDGTRCGFIFASLKPTGISTTNYRPVVGYVRHQISSDNYVDSIYSITTNSDYYDSKTGYRITYATEWGLLWSQMNSGLGVGAGIPVLDLSGATQTEGLQYILNNVFNDGNWTNPRDPYAGGGMQPTSETGGGEGTFTDVNTPIDFPPLPTISVVDTGFITLYNPTETQLKNLAAYMWTNPLFDLTNWKALFANPMDCILSLALLPVAIPNGGSGTVKVGNISTDVTMTKAAQQFIEFDCGSITIPEKWGCYLDYTPYTKLSIFLPFIGVHEMQADEIMDKSIHLKYQIDIFTGACSAFIKCGDSVLYTFTGQCGFTVPISGNDYTSIVGGILSAVGSVGSVAVSGGMTAPAAVSSILSTVQNTFATKPNVSHGSGLAGNSGFLSVRTPYLILTRPNLCLPANQNTFLGYPVYITDTLSNLSGFTVVENIFFNDFSGTTEEQDEIIEILKSGVII